MQRPTVPHALLQSHAEGPLVRCVVEGVCARRWRCRPRRVADVHRQRRQVTSRSRDCALWSPGSLYGCAPDGCAVLCCAVLCCAVLCCAVLCCAVLCCAMLCCAVPCCGCSCSVKEVRDAADVGFVAAAKAFEGLAAARVASALAALEASNPKAALRIRGALAGGGTPKSKVPPKSPGERRVLCCCLLCRCAVSVVRLIGRMSRSSRCHGLRSSTWAVMLISAGRDAAPPRSSTESVSSRGAKPPLRRVPSVMANGHGGGAAGASGGGGGGGSAAAGVGSSGASSSGLQSKTAAKGGSDGAVAVAADGGLPSLDGAMAAIADLGVDTTGIDSAKWQDKVRVVM